MKIAILIAVTISLLIFPSSIKAVVPASDIVSLYENGNRVSNSSVIYYGSDSYSPVCTDGNCLIDQTSNEITFYVTSEDTVLDYSEWCDLYKCSRNDYDEYLNGLKEESIYSSSVTFGLTEGCHGCSLDYEGGVVGTPRDLHYDLITGELSNEAFNLVDEKTYTIKEKIINFFLDLFSFL